jgi:hypothetical protein
MNGRAAGAAGDAARAADRVALERPTRLLAEVTPCGTALSWDRTDGATSYRILRANYRAVDVNFRVPPKLPNGTYPPDALPLPALPGSRGSKSKRAWIAGDYRVIGTTRAPSFIDHSATRGGRYDYVVVAVGASGAASHPSNVAALPTQLPRATFSRLDAGIRRVAGTPNGTDGKRGTAATASALLELADAAETSWQRTERAVAVRRLSQLRAMVEAYSSHAKNAAAVSDLQDTILHLQRRASVDAACTR